MNNGHRDILRNFAYKKIEENVDRKQENKLYAKILSFTNSVICKRYPEEDMAILRKYELAGEDTCVKYSFDGGRVDGFNFSQQKGGVPKDTPKQRYCNNNNVYMTTKEFEKDFREYNKIKTDNEKILYQKKVDCNSLIAYAKYIEDVLEVIKVPKQLEHSLLAKSTSLVAVSPDVIKRIQADFNS